MGGEMAGMSGEEQIRELREIMLQTVRDLGEIKGQLSAVSSIDRKLDEIRDVAQAAKASTESAHKRLDEKLTDITEAKKTAQTASTAAAAAQAKADNNEKRLDKADQKIWGLIILVAGAVIKMFFDLFKAAPPGGQ